MLTSLASFIRFHLIVKLSSRQTRYLYPNIFLPHLPHADSAYFTNAIISSYMDSVYYFHPCKKTCKAVQIVQNNQLSFIMECIKIILLNVLPFKKSSDMVTSQETDGVHSKYFGRLTQPLPGTDVNPFMESIKMCKNLNNKCDPLRLF